MSYLQYLQEKEKNSHRIFCNRTRWKTVKERTNVIFHSSFCQLLLLPYYYATLLLLHYYYAPIILDNIRAFKMETFLNFPSTLQSSTNIKYFEREYSSICYLSHTIFIDADILVLVFLFSVVLYSFFLIIIYTYSHCFLGSFLSLTLSL